jgi:hypothetical protein
MNIKFNILTTIQVTKCNYEILPSRFSCLSHIYKRKKNREQSYTQETTGALSLPIYIIA